MRKVGVGKQDGLPSEQGGLRMDDRINVPKVGDQFRISVEGGMVG